LTRNGIESPLELSSKYNICLVQRQAARCHGEYLHV